MAAQRERELGRERERGLPLSSSRRGVPYPAEPVEGGALVERAAAVGLPVSGTMGATTPPFTGSALLNSGLLAPGIVTEP